MKQFDNRDDLIEIRDLSVTTGDGSTLLSDVSLSFASHKIYTLLGPSGCGKSTLLRVMCGLEQAQSGAVFFNGSEAGSDGWPEFRSRLGYVSQVPLLFEGTVESNFLRPFSYRSNEQKTPSRDLMVSYLKRVGLAQEVLSKQSINLSVGEQQRVSILRSLFIEPDALLLDEPTSALDVESRDCVEALIKSLSLSGMCIIIVSHEPAQASRLGGIPLNFKGAGIYHE